MELVCFQGNDKQNWAQINALIKRGEWDNVILVKSSNAESFPAQENIKIVEVDSDLPLLELKAEIINKLKPTINREFEVALSIASGSGKENMALISALLSIPVGIKLVAYTKNGIQFIS